MTLPITQIGDTTTTSSCTHAMPTNTLLVALAVASHLHPRAAALSPPPAPVASGPGFVADYSALGGKPFTVSWDSRSMRFNGLPALLQSGSIHYTRSTPSQWPHLFAEARAAQYHRVLRVLELPCARRQRTVRLHGQRQRRSLSRACRQEQPLCDLAVWPLRLRRMARWGGAKMGRPQGLQSAVDRRRDQVG